MWRVPAAVLLALAVPVGQADAQVEGLWLNPHNSVAVRTGSCGDRLCGWVVWANAAARQDARDGGDGELIGTRLLENYRPDGRSWAGTVYVPDMGRRFSSQIQEMSPQQLKITGCLLGGFICRSQTWTRIEKTPDA
ncbi:DUF2147 domain-containing protein [Sphingobium sp. BYY-5]|uniref:DUF2147 domain-containing protein n=1 Tax=Sphingobium sp. BYY-5 TaxID=2926400 RepID=UPI001FA7E442|nr:DUF2147 domain-containing protein [Sphingobium sp. BYY-5]MCI4589385.1 DUF2147 domain-containing protein [Sphingobium sp. BYY-5]